MIQITDDTIKIRQATRLGYAEIPLRERVIGVADLSFPTNKTRRGRVEDGGQICPTLTTTGGLYVFEEVTNNECYNTD